MKSMVTHVLPLKSLVSPENKDPLVMEEAKGSKDTILPIPKSIPLLTCEKSKIKLTSVLESI